ncbi:redoxin domain-containing protein [Gordonia sp. (in: high G+C Gram-positive bacteria)]|uniref:redoxin domain-containing protein n=1 Tax=Gordonia sp. (in: high G+C Gram-positive bacteria) TaxID=84139 RepID=UPI0016A9A589|nr:redoxin domain-containing protein [Gordonia sp. (in: high G+C Gram-positive bacteria)]NLG48454.1 redoxin domain-containing protein [Gordonia sp. (in: high G+C Gram-positive bacteria)]
MTAKSVAGPLEVGSPAPVFDLRDQNNQAVALDKLRDRNVLIVFFPLAFTGTCEGELGYLRDNLPRFDNDDLTVVAISVGPPPTHKVWASAQGFLFPILSDFWPHGSVAQEYGVFDAERGFPNRGTFVVGRDGAVKFSAMVGPGEMRGDETWDAALAAIAD